MTSLPAFADLPAPIAAALERRGFEALTPVQRAVAVAEARGRDLRISSQTGSGKTVAIGLALADHFIQGRPDASSAPAEADAEADGRGPRGPASARAARPQALVIVPTRELAAQVREELRWLYAELPRVEVGVVTGGTSVEGERRALARGPELVVGTPGRLLDHLRSGALDCRRIAHVVLDEADQMLDMGFREELEAILEQLPAERASHLVSATFPRAVVALAKRFQKDPLVLEGTRLGVANADIRHIAYAIRRHETYPALVNLLLMAEGERCLLFVARRVDATELAEKLANDGFGAAPFSGELPQAQRTRTLAAFRSGTLPILVSTEVAARGIDVPDISTVIHVDPPRTPDAYTHRSGRTGRAGQAGRSLLFVTPPDLPRIERMLRHARIDVSWQPVPPPEKVEKALRKRARRALHERLAGDAPDEAQWMYAKQLLEDRDPVQVVATLLELAAPEPVRTPMRVVGFDPTRGPARGRREGPGRDQAARRGPERRPGHHPGPEDRRDAAAHSDRGARPDAAPEDFTRFFVSWGEQSGATTGRLLSQVCRRGGIESDQVGAIEIAARVSFVGIRKEVAEAFEARVARPDPRDPGIVIKRAEERRPKHVASGATDPRSGPPTGPSSGAHRDGPPRGPRSGPRRFEAGSGGRVGRPERTLHRPGGKSGRPVRPGKPQSGPKSDARGPRRGPKR